MSLLFGLSDTGNYHHYSRLRYKGVEGGGLGKGGGAMGDGVRLA